MRYVNHIENKHTLFVLVMSLREYAFIYTLCKQAMSHLHNSNQSEKIVVSPTFHNRYGNMFLKRSLYKPLDTSLKGFKVLAHMTVAGNHSSCCVISNALFIKKVCIDSDQ